MWNPGMKSVLQGLNKNKRTETNITEYEQKSPERGGKRRVKAKVQR